ncbi:MAG: hypothetical protein AAF533_13270 [Acidobacteriota bacterium]
MGQGQPYRNIPPGTELEIEDVATIIVTNTDEGGARHGHCHVRLEGQAVDAELEPYSVYTWTVPDGYRTAPVVVVENKGPTVLQVGWEGAMY